MENTEVQRGQVWQHGEKSRTYTVLHVGSDDVVLEVDKDPEITIRAKPGLLIERCYLIGNTEVTDLSNPATRERWEAQKQRMIEVAEQRAASLAPLTKPLMPKGRIVFYWYEGHNDYQWRLFEDWRCIEHGSSKSWHEASTIFKSRRALHCHGRPEDHYRKPQESDEAPQSQLRRANPYSPSEQRVTPQEGAQRVTRGYLSESNDYWDKGNYWSGVTWEKELDAILAPLNLDQKIRVLESVKGAVHPEEIRDRAPVRDSYQAYIATKNRRRLSPKALVVIATHIWAISFVAGIALSFPVMAFVGSLVLLFSVVAFVGFTL
jgi:hypothetical protein